MVKLLEMIAGEEPDPIGTLAPDLPGSLAQLVHRTLAKRREDRPGTASELRVALLGVRREILCVVGLSEGSGSLDSAPPDRPTSRASTAVKGPSSRLPLLLTAAALLLLAVVGRRIPAGCLTPHPIREAVR